MIGILHNEKNIYHTIIGLDNSLIISIISMIDSFLKSYLSCFCRKNMVSIMLILYLF